MNAKFAVKILIITLIVTARLGAGWFFDSMISYRHGSNTVNIDSAFRVDESEPDVPGSVDDVFAYTSSNAEDDSINVVHCYMIRNGLYGSPKEARVIWSLLDFSNPDYHRTGHAHVTRIVSFPIETKIENFAVYETDLSAFLMSQSKDAMITLHIVPGPANGAGGELRTFTFEPADQHRFTTDQMLIIPQAKKLIIYGAEHFGEVSFEDHLNDEAISPSIKVYNVHSQIGTGSRQNQSDGLRYDKSDACSLLDV